MLFDNPQFNKRRKKQRRILWQNANDRVGVGEWAAGVSRDQRNWADLKIRPVERALSSSIRNRISGDQGELISGAQQSVFDSYDKSADAAGRSAARYGVNIDPSEDPGFGLDRTRDAVAAGNLAAQVDRDNALQDARRFYQNGAELPGMATQQYVAGGGSIVDQEDYISGQKYGEATGQLDALDQVGMGWANAYSGGGSVSGGPKMGIAGVHGRTVIPERRNSRVINGESKRVELSSGDFIVPAHAEEFYGKEFWDKLVAENGGNKDQNTEASYADGGSVTNTIRLKNKHTQEYSSGNTDKQFGEWLQENGYELTADNQVRVKNDQDKKNGYAEGGGVGFGLGYEQGYARSIGPIVGAVKKGLTAGLLDARESQDHERRVANENEDRAYLREERAYQKSQREKADIKEAYSRDLDAATAQFVQSDGINLAPIVGVRKKYAKEDGDVSVVPNQDGTFNVTEIGKDGKPVSEPQKLSRDQIRSVGMNMIEAMRDPKALLKSWNEKPTTVNTPYGGITHAYDPRTRKWSPIADNNSDIRASQGTGRGGRGSDILGWKDHNQMNDDIQRLAFRRFAVPSPNGVGSILDPEGQQKAGMFKNFVFAELDKLGKSPRELTSSELNAAAGLAEAAVEEQFRRRGAKGIKGAGKGWLDRFDADKAAADMSTYFPRGGSEPEMRAFMAQRDITDKADQDQVLAKMQTYLNGPKGGISAGPSAKPVQNTGQRTPADVKAEYKAGRISRDQAVQELKSMGFQ